MQSFIKGSSILHPFNDMQSSYCPVHRFSKASPWHKNMHTLRANDKYIQPHLKAWSSVGLVLCMGSFTRAQRVRRGVSDGLAGRGGDASPSNGGLKWRL